MAIRHDNRRPARNVRPKGKLIIFGRPTLMWEGAPTPEEYYKSFGYSEVHTLDVSDYQGATFVHDLNDPELPEHLKGQYADVSFGGTSEHVFNVGYVLRKAAQLVEVGGVVTCAAPANNWLDHGFYQLCPTLKFDFFEQNGFELLTSLCCIFRPDEGPFRRYVPIYPFEVQALNYIPARISHTLIARKLKTSTCDRIPLQSVYRAKHNGEQIAWRFRAASPYDVVNGKRLEAPMRRFALDMTRAEKTGNYWAVPFTEQGFPASIPQRPFLSKGLVYENGRLLNWIVSSPSMVGEKPGSFHHGPGFIYLSPREFADPLKENRKFEVAFPQPFHGMEPYADDPDYVRPADASTQ